MKDKQIITLDWDGTSINSTEIGFIKLEAALKELNLVCPPREFLRKHWGMEVSQLYKLILNEIGNHGYTCNELAYVYENNKKEYPDLKNVELTLNQLKSFGYKIALITSRKYKSWLECCRLSNFNPKTFDFIQTIYHCNHQKPSGRVFGPLINWARRHDLGPEHIVYFGDTIAYDYQATLNCEPPIDFIGIVSGVNTKEEFIQAGLSPDRIIDSYDDVLVYLKQLIQQKVEVS